MYRCQMDRAGGMRDAAAQRADGVQVSQGAEGSKGVCR